jgi:hypothetical protein
MSSGNKMKNLDTDERILIQNIRRVKNINIEHFLPYRRHFIDDFLINIEVKLIIALEKFSIYAVNNLLNVISNFKNGDIRPSSLLLELFVPSEKGIDLADNFEYLYENRWLKRYGPVFAKLIFYFQMIYAIGSVWLSPLVKLISNLKNVFGAH